MGILSQWLHNIRVKKIAPYIHGDVLDLGCGPATNFEFSKYKIKSYIGVDYNNQIVKSMSEKYPEASFFKKDLDCDKLDFKKKFDCVILAAVVEHIFNQKHLFTEITKHLKPSGIIIITTPTVFGNDVVHELGSNIGLFSKEASDDHITIFNKKRFKILANEVGLKIKDYKLFELGCNQLVVMSKLID